MGLDKVNYFLNNKIVLCTGTGFHRKEMLLDTYKNDIRFLSFKKIFLATTDPDNMKILFGRQSPVSELFPDLGKQLNSINCVLLALKKAVNDPEINDDDILLFKHESYFIKDLDLIRKALGTIVLNGCDMVIQTFRDWYHNGSFFIKASAARPLFQNISLLKAFPPNAPTCELYLTNRIFNQLKRVYTVSCDPYEGQDNRLGFYHIPPKLLEPWMVWDKRNAKDLFKDVFL